MLKAVTSDLPRFDENKKSCTGPQTLNFELKSSENTSQYIKIEKIIEEPNSAVGIDDLKIYPSSTNIPMHKRFPSK
jgi:hypothetical protein